MQDSFIPLNFEEYDSDAGGEDSFLKEVEEKPRRLMSPRSSLNKSNNDELIRKAATVQKNYITSQLNDQSDQVEKYNEQYTSRRRSIIKTLKSMVTPNRSVSFDELVIETSSDTDDKLDLIYELASDYNMTPVSVP